MGDKPRGNRREIFSRVTFPRQPELLGPRGWICPIKVGHERGEGFGDVVLVPCVCVRTRRHGEAGACRLVHVEHIEFAVPRCVSRVQRAVVSNRVGAVLEKKTILLRYRKSRQRGRRQPRTEEEAFVLATCGMLGVPFWARPWKNALPELREGVVQPCDVLWALRAAHPLS